MEQLFQPKEIVAAESNGLVVRLEPMGLQGFHVPMMWN